MVDTSSRKESRKKDRLVKQRHPPTLHYKKKRSAEKLPTFSMKETKNLNKLVD